MKRDLHRLVYYSRNCIAGTPAEIAAEVDLILAASQRNNARIGVTGALIFNTGIFAQVLEGAQHDIEATFERIQRDERHGEVNVLALDETPYRGFPSWSMAFVGQSRAGQTLFAHIEKTTGFETRRMEGERIFEILRAIAMDEEAQTV